jgi:hypothetical protein
MSEEGVPKAKTSVRSSQPFPKLDLCLVFFWLVLAAGTYQQRHHRIDRHVICKSHARHCLSPIKLAMALLRSKFRIRWDDDIVALALI